MLLRCPACDAQCAVDESTSPTASCPSCGCRLISHNARQDATIPDTSQPETRPWSPQTAAPVQADILPHRAGRYRLESLLGRGGFAFVYLAHDEELHRPVALKLPRPDRFSSREELATLLSEARTAARLSHACIVTIFDVGHLPDGAPFIAMEYVAGQSLKEMLARRRISWERGVDLLAAVAEAAHYAHGLGFVHRDLKPANILINERGEPKIVDFGLAVHESGQRRLSGDLSGTPAYMPPELVRGEAHRMDGRVDVWSLGVILYELLTGRRPFDGDVQQVFDEIEHRAPKPPRQINDQIPRALEAICLRCLSKDIDKRFTTCLDLADSLRDWRDPSPAPNPPIVARPPASEPKPWATFSKAIPLLATCAALLLVMLAIWQGGMLGGRAKGDAPTPGMPSGSAPRVWRSLLDQPPVPRVWCDLTPDAQWNYDAAAKTLLVTTSELGMFSLGEVNRNSFRLEVRFAKSAWNGDSGVFWGMRSTTTSDGDPAWECEAIYLHPYLDRDKPAYRLNREWLQAFTPKGSECALVNRKQYFTQLVEPPESRECSLEIFVLEHIVREVRFQGKLCPDLCDQLDRVTPPYPLVAQGALGAINQQGSVVFREARLQVFPPSK